MNFEQVAILGLEHGCSTREDSGGHPKTVQKLKKVSSRKLPSKLNNWRIFHLPMLLWVEHLMKILIQVSEQVCFLISENTSLEVLHLVSFTNSLPLCQFMSEKFGVTKCLLINIPKKISTK
jgi:hypothetical protein